MGLTPNSPARSSGLSHKKQLTAILACGKRRGMTCAAVDNRSALCGRGEPASPLQPLTEGVIVYKKCSCGKPCRRSGRYCLECHAAYQRHWRVTHPLTAEQRQRSNVRAYLRVYVKRGKVEKQPCEICGQPAQAHHHDYSKPLVVQWLCRLHHLNLHGKMLFP